MEGAAPETSLLPLVKEPAPAKPSGEQYKIQIKMVGEAPESSLVPLAEKREAVEPSRELLVSDITADADDSSNEEKSAENSVKFTLFPELPIEIRLQIFRTMFPSSRHVCLDVDFPWTFNYESSIQAQNRIPLPPTLFINQESRSETLKHYQVVFKSDSTAFKGYEPFAERPFCFNSRIDSVYITFGSLHGGTNYRRFDTWMDYLNAQLPGGTNSIQSLEVRDMSWEAPIKAWIQGESPLPSLAKCNKGGGLQWFRGLSELCFTQHRDADNGLRYRRGGGWRRSITQHEFNTYAHEITNWYAERTLGGRVPHVMVRGFKKVKWSALNTEE